MEGPFGLVNYFKENPEEFEMLSERRFSKLTAPITPKVQPVAPQAKTVERK